MLNGVHRNGTMDEKFKGRLINMMNIAYYVVKKEKPFTDFPEQVELAARVNSDVLTYYKSDKACAR